MVKLNKTANIVSDVDKPVLTKEHYYPIREILIDMTGWKNNETDQLDKEIYPYSVEYMDLNDSVHRFATTKITSNGMNEMLTYLRDTYHVMPTDSTFVKIITPVECIHDDGSGYGKITKTSVKDLRLHAMEVFPFRFEQGLTNDRLQSVLDEVVHKSVLEYKTCIKKRGNIFKRSVYRYHDEESVRNNELESAIRMHTVEKDDRSFHF
ncbi:hypothetical protein J6A31_04765 [bacterium]|nr:hypothetical protein [bacterium]